MFHLLLLRYPQLQQLHVYLKLQLSLSYIIKLVYTKIYNLFISNKYNSKSNIFYIHNNITLAIITKGISQYNHLSRRSIASPAGAGRNPSDTGRRPVQATCPTYRFSFSSTVFIRSSVNPNREANFLKACILLLGIREYILLMGVSLFNAFCTCFFFMELMY